MGRRSHFGLRRWAGFCLAAVLAAWAAGPVVRGQLAGAGGPDGTVTGVGSAAVERRPELVRMQVDISADGKDAKEALANLKAAEKGVREKLAKLGADEKAVKVEDAHVSNPTTNDRRARMEAMIRARSGGGGKKPTTAPAQPPVHVTATVKAEWPVKAQSADDLIAEGHELQAKVKAANLVAAPAKEGLTPEQEEEAEERAGMAAAGMDGEGNPGEPVFVYVIKVTDAERAKATADAFKRAKEEADRLAKAAGAELGALRQLASQAGPEADASSFGGFDYSSPYGRAVYGLYQRQQQQQAGGGDGSGAAEAIGLMPGKVTYRVAVTAAFAIKGQ